MKVRVRCSFDVEVEYPDDTDLDALLFQIEDNGCPGTGQVGSAVEKLIELHESQSTCWACASRGNNKVISIDGKELGSHLPRA